VRTPQRYKHRNYGLPQPRSRLGDECYNDREATAEWCGSSHAVSHDSPQSRRSGRSCTIAPILRFEVSLGCSSAAARPAVYSLLRAPVAQWTEHRTSNPTAAGSNPAGGVSRIAHNQGGFFARRRRFREAALYGSLYRSVTVQTIRAIESDRHPPDARDRPRDPAGARRGQPRDGLPARGSDRWLSRTGTAAYYSTPTRPPSRPDTS
jgi:hypothetical protein